MSESVWLARGGTLSHNNACEEFGLSETELFEAMRTGRMQYRTNYAHGNPYYKLLRAEVESLAIVLHGRDAVEKQKIDHKIQDILSEMNSCKRKLAALEREKARLLQDREKLCSR